MSMGYLQMIVRAGSRPIMPSRSDGVRHAQVNRASVLEKTAYSFIPSVKTQRQFSPANRRQDHQEIRDESVCATQEGAVHSSPPAQAAISDDHDGQISQNSGVKKAFLVPGTLAPTAQIATSPQPAAVPGNDVAIYDDATERRRIGPLENNVSSHYRRDLHPQQKAEQDSPHPEEVVDRSAGPESIADAPPVIQLPPGEARSIEEEGRQDEMIPVVATPSAALSQPSSTSAPDSDRHEEKQGAEQNQPQSGIHSSGTEIPQHTAASVAGSPQPEGVSRPLRRQKAANDPHMDLSVFYVTPRQPAAEASEMPKSTPRQSLISNMEQPKVRTVKPEADAGKAAKAISPAVEDSRPAGEPGGHDAIADRLSATKPQGASPMPIREVSPPPHREPEPPAARPRGQTPMLPSAGTGPPHKDEKGPRLLIHRLDVQIVTRQQPEPVCQIPQPQSAATQREAWEGVDRYYLHRIYAGA